MEPGQDRVAAAGFDPEPSAVATARCFVRDTLISWGLPGRDDVVTDAVLLASELVTNAIVHAGTAVELTCRFNGATVEISVLDRHPARVIPDPPTPAADVARPSGRGLLLPAALSSSWGVTYASAAKVIWFRLGPDAPAAAGPAIAESLAAADQPGGRPAEPAAEHGGARDLLQLGYDELLGHAVTVAREAVAADAAYALMADEDGELRMRAATGRGVTQARVGEAAAAAGAADPTGMGTFLDLYDQFAERGADLAQIQNEPRRSLLTVPFQVEGRVAGMLAVAAAGPGRFAETDLARVQHVADQVALPLERARLAEHDRIRRARLSFLAEASDLLAGCLDQEKTIALAAQLVVPRLGTWFAALLPGDDGELSPACVWHADESLADELTRLLRAVPAPRLVPGDSARPWSLASAAAGRPPGPPFGAAGLASDPAWCFSLVARERNLGVIVIGRPREGALAGEAVGLAEDLTRRVALALDNARLYSEQRQATSALQRSLLPPELPDIPGIELAAGYEAAGEGSEVGGDFYDVFEATPGRWRFAIGDVCGQGPEAAAVTGLTRHALRILAREGHDVATVLERLNALIVDEGARARFITLIHGELIPASGPGEAAVVTLVCAGHPLPLVLRADGMVQTAADPQPLLGVLDHVTFGHSTIRMSPGDVLLCVTDGVTERRSAGRLLDDDDGLRSLLRQCSELNAGSVVARIQRAVREFGSDPPADDLALLVFRGL